MIVGISALLTACIPQSKKDLNLKYTCIFLNDLMTRVEVYRMDNGECPSGSGWAKETEAQNPEDSWGNEMKYACTDQEVDVMSAGPDGKFGNDDDIDKAFCIARVNYCEGQPNKRFPCF